MGRAHQGLDSPWERQICHQVIDFKGLTTVVCHFVGRRLATSRFDLLPNGLAGKSHLVCGACVALDFG
jgi:hypothetical protein